MESHSQVRFSDTPPDSPKSCMKGSRRINFAESNEEGSSEPVAATSPKSPHKRSTKTVVIRSPGTSTAGTTTSDNQSESVTQKRPDEIQFQFHLSQHYEQSTPPPNCTSNGGSHYDNPETTVTEPTNSCDDDPKKDPQLMEIASKFVNEIIEKAKVEAATRQKAESGSDARTRPMAAFRAVAEDFLAGRNPWYRRAHGAVSKWFTNLCVRAQNSIRT